MLFENPTWPHQISLTWGCTDNDFTLTLTYMYNTAQKMNLLRSCPNQKRPLQEVEFVKTKNGSVYLFGVLLRFQHCTGHITTGSWKGRGYQYIQFVRVLYCKLPTNGKQLPAFPLEAMPGTEPGLRGGRRECCPKMAVHPKEIAKVLKYTKT